MQAQHLLDTMIPQMARLVENEGSAAVGWDDD